MDTITPHQSRTCKECGRELPMLKFKTMRNGQKACVCNDCVQAKRRATRAQKTAMLQCDTIISDPQFDDMQPRDVIDMMSRAKRWLESRGYTITLYGEYREVKIHTIRF